MLNKTKIDSSTLSLKANLLGETISSSENSVLPPSLKNIKYFTRLFIKDNFIIEKNNLIEIKKSIKTFQI